jgi:hypothetical protein
MIPSRSSATGEPSITVTYPIGLALLAVTLAVRLASARLRRGARSA